jgi:hypothetical protein
MNEWMDGYCFLALLLLIITTMTMTVPLLIKQLMIPSIDATRLIFVQIISSMNSNPRNCLPDPRRTLDDNCISEVT